MVEASTVEITRKGSSRSQLAGRYGEHGYKIEILH